MDTKDNKASVQELAEFLQNMAYSDKLFHHTDKSLSVETPRDANGDIVYQGRLGTRGRVEMQLHHFGLTFCFTVTQGFFAVIAKKDGGIIDTVDTMDFEQFKSFAKKLFEVEELYKSSKCTEPLKTRPAKDVPSIQEVAEFMVNVSKSENGMNHPVGWLLHILHPRDIYGDICYSGGLWTHHELSEPFPKPYNSVHISYSKTRGIYGFQAWEDKSARYEREKISFDDFKVFVIKLFDVKDM